MTDGLLLLKDIKPWCLPVIVCGSVKWESCDRYPDGQYSLCSNPKWIDNNTIVFGAGLSYNYMEAIENVIVKYNVLDNFLEYIKQSTKTGMENPRNNAEVRTGYIVQEQVIYELADEVEYIFTDINLDFIKETEGNRVYTTT